MTKAIATGFIASSDYIPVYGRSVLDEDAIRKMFAQYRTHGVPMVGNHDERNVIDGRVLTVELRRTPDGGLGIWAEVEVDEAQMAEYHGWSIGWFEDNYRAPDTDPRPLVRFGADASHFTDEERDQVAAILGERFRVVGGRYYQLGLEPPATVVLMLVDQAIKGFPDAVLVSLLFAGLRKLLPRTARSAPTLFKFNVVKTPDATEVRGILETSEPEALRDALTGLKDLADTPAGHYELDEHLWRPIGDRRSPPKHRPPAKKRDRRKGSTSPGRH